MKTTVEQIKRLQQIAKQLDKASSFFEERGLDAQMKVLDAAADKVEEMADMLATI